MININLFKSLNFIILLLICACTENGETKISEYKEKADKTINKTSIDNNKLKSGSSDSISKINSVKILSIDKVYDTNSVFYNKYLDVCKKWHLDTFDITTILIESKILDGHTYHNFFDILPCSYVGDVLVNGYIKAKYEINAGSSSIIVFENKQFIYLGFYKKKYFLNYPSSP